MKLYLVISSYDYEGGCIQGVFTSRARAKECLATCKVDPFSANWHHIAQVKANDASISITVPTEDES